MDAEKLNQELYSKMVAEHEDYHSWLLEQKPEIILKHAYKDMVLKDILLSMKGLNLPTNQVEALLTSSYPLMDIYKKVYDMDASLIDTSYMNSIRKCIRERAEELVGIREEHWRDPYLHDMSYAEQHGELDQYRSSYFANIHCMRAITDALSNNYDVDSGTLYEDTTAEVLSDFGPKRVSFVLSATLQDRDFDPHFSKENMEWAATIPTFDDGVQLLDYTVKSHAVPLNCFVTLARQRIAQMQVRTDLKKSQPTQKPSIKKQLAAKPVHDNQPAKPMEREGR